MKIDPEIKRLRREVWQAEQKRDALQDQCSRLASKAAQVDDLRETVRNLSMMLAAVLARVGQVTIPADYLTQTPRNIHRSQSGELLTLKALPKGRLITLDDELPRLERLSRAQQMAQGLEQNAVDEGGE